MTTELSREATACDIHAETDRLIPPANAKLIADRIPGAKLVLIPHAGHIFETDQPAATHHAILEFLAAQRSRAHRTLLPGDEERASV